MSGEAILLIWVLVAAAFALGWGVRHWLHRSSGGEDQAPSAETDRPAGSIDLRDEALGHEIDLREGERSEDRER